MVVSAQQRPQQPIFDPFRLHSYARRIVLSGYWNYFDNADGRIQTLLMSFG
jgi:hypothetical protein